MAPGPLDPLRLEEFAVRVSAHPRRRMDSAAIWSAFAAAFPARPVGSEERVWLKAALENLESRGILRLPSTPWATLGSDDRGIAASLGGSR